MSFTRDVALIGAGYWGKNLARSFNALGALHTICDLDPRTLAGYSDGYERVLKTSDVESPFKNAEIKKIAIVAPAALHYQLAKTALSHGKDVLVEKPLCLNETEGEELVDLGSKTGQVLMVGHLLQYHPHIQKLQSLVGSGELGRLYYITSNRLNLGKIRQEENALWSFAPHDISVILSLVANQLPDGIQCSGQAYLSHGVADMTLTTLRFSGGVRAHVYVNWLNPFKEQKLAVVGSNGMAVFDDGKPWGEKLVLYRQHLTWTDGRTPTPSKAAGEAIQVPESEPLRNECVHFLECCNDRRPPRTDASEGLRVLRVLAAAQRSMSKDGAVERVSCPEPAQSYYAHPTAVIDEGAVIGKGTKIWHFSHVMKGAELGEECNLGQNVVISPRVKLGRNVKVQNNVSIYTGVTCEDDVFLGPSCVLTNISNPRSEVRRQHLYEKTVIKKGATIGANATIVCGVTLGRYCFIAAGAVITKDVPDYAMMVGVPARQKGWMSRHGHRLMPSSDGNLVCPESGLRYHEEGPDRLVCLALPEDAPLTTHPGLDV